METKTSVIWGATYLRVLPVIAAMAISAAFPVPVGATNVSSPSAVYNPDRDRIDVFVTGDDGNLYCMTTIGMGVRGNGQTSGCLSVRMPSVTQVRSTTQVIILCSSM